MLEPRDHHLLLGILALQSGLVSSDQLAKGIRCWCPNPQTPLGDILQQQGALEEDEKRLLESAVEKQLSRHGSVIETTRSLRMESRVRELMGIGLDGNLESQLDSLATLNPTPPSEHKLAGRGTAEEGRFRVLRPHARGGLGEVFVARDEELGRDVALKEILAPYANDAEIRARFVLEAEITGGLEHPGIVPVYGLGHRTDGRPYYAMRFIRGESLGAAICRLHGTEVSPQPLSQGQFLLRQLLGRFVAVCNAVAYAHSRGVIHRDIKPDNIMLGPYGETLLVDWGLAKLVAQPTDERLARESTLHPQRSHSATPTAMGSVVGTPAFMSPEQAAGLVDQLGPATDIYGLGATLYMLLTGRPAFQSKADVAILEEVMAGKFPAPRKVNRQVPPALEAICLKAMAIAPAKRYTSARHLADDLDAWLAGERVGAWREPQRVRAARWMRRHRTLVVGTAATLLVTLVSLTAATLLLTAANERERQAKFLAQRRSQEALDNYKTALGVVNTYFTKVSTDRRLNEQGLESLRADLLQEARKVLSQFIAQRPHDPALLSEWAYTQVRLAYIIDQIGSKQEVVGLLEQARDIFKSLVRSEPAEIEHRIRLSAVYTNLSAAYQDLGRGADAEKTMETGRRFAEEFLRNHPQEEDVRRRLATTYCNLGKVQFDRQCLQEAEKLYRAALAVYRKLQEQFPELPKYRFYIASTLNQLGIVLNRGGHFAEASEAFVGARGLLQPLAAARLNDPDFQREMASIHIGLAHAGPAEAGPAFQTAIDIYQRLIDKHPEVILDQINLATCRGDYAGLLAAQRRFAEAQVQYEAARKLWLLIVAKHGDVPGYQNSLAACLEGLARVQKSGSKAAEQWYRAGIEIHRRLAAGSPHMPKYQFSLGDAYVNFGESLLSCERYEDAEEPLKQAMATLEPLKSQFSSPEFRVELAKNLTLLSQAAMGMGRAQEGLDWSNKATDILHADAALQDYPLAKNAIRNARLARAQTLSQLGRHTEALAEWDWLVESGTATNKSWTRLQRAEALARAGDHARAIAEGKDLLGVIGDWGLTLYHMGSLYSLASAAVAKDAALRPAQRDRQAIEYAAVAMLFLEHAQAVGYFNDPVRQKKLQTDAALHPLRSREDFHALLKAAPSK